MSRPILYDPKKLIQALRYLRRVQILVRLSILLPVLVVTNLAQYFIFKDALISVWIALALALMSVLISIFITITKAQYRSALKNLK